MKCRDLKAILSKIDDDMEISIHIFNNKCDANVFLTEVNDSVNNRITLNFADENDVI